MDTNTLIHAVDNPAIDQVAEPLSKAVRGACEAAGPAGRRAKDALHGVSALNGFEKTLTRPALRC